MIRIGLGISTVDTSIISLPTISTGSQYQQCIPSSSPGITQITPVGVTEADRDTNSKSVSKAQKVSMVRFDTSQGIQSCTSTIDSRADARDTS